MATLKEWTGTAWAPVSSSAFVTVNEAPLTVERYGAQGDGATNDAAAIQAAINAAATFGLPVRLRGGATYRINSSLSLPSRTRLDLNGAVLDFSQSGSSAYINVLGSVAAAVAVTGSVAVGAYTVTAPGHVLAAGDWVKLRSSDKFDAANTNIDKGEILQVRSVDGDVVTFWSPTCDSYSTTVQLRKLSMVRDVTVEGGTVRGNRTANTGKTGLRADTTRNLLVRGVRFEDIDLRHVGIGDSVNAWVLDSSCEWTAHASMGYGISFYNSTRDSGAVRCRFVHCRHSLSTNNAIDGGVVRRIRFAHNTVEGSAPATGGSGGDAIDTHGAAEDIWIEYNTVNGSSGQGINHECKSGHIIGNRVRACATNGISARNESDQVGFIVVSGNVVEDVGWSGIVIRSGTRGTTATYRGIVCTGNIVRGAATKGIWIGYTRSTATILERNVTVTGNTVNRSGEHGLIIQNADTVVESGNTLYDCANGIKVQDVTYATIGPSAVRNFTAYVGYRGIHLVAVTRSRVQPGAIRSSGATDNIGVLIDVGCADMTVGKAAHVFSGGPKVSDLSGSATVVLD